MKARRGILAAVTALGLGAIAAGIPAAAGAGGAAKTKQAQVLDDYYTPTKIKLAKGSSVKWTWGNDQDTHNVTLRSGPKGVKIFRSPTRTSGTFKKKFTVPGTYKFHCTVHPTSMNMKVVVAG